MLLLAGLMGIAGVGAASFAVFHLQESEDEDAQLQDTLDLEETGNLLEEIDQPKRNVISGTDQADVPAGTPSADTIIGGAGIDQIGGYECDDLLFGGEGHDQLFGEIGQDTLFGHTGNDQLFGNEGYDSLVGSSGNDILFGDDGNDALMGGQDDDVLWGGSGSDVLNGGAGQDVLRGVLKLEPGMMTDEDQGDYLNGGADSDTIIAGTNDIVTSGEGEDQILFGDWISQGEEAEITDYDAREDSLMVVWDDMASGASEPDVGVQPDGYDDEVMHVMMNGKSVAEVYGDPNLSTADIMVIPLSSALIVDLQPA